MTEQREKAVDDLMGKMTLDHKIGGVLLYDFMGTVMAPYNIKLLREYHVGGFRADTFLRGKVSYAKDPASAGQGGWLAKSDRQRTGLCKDFATQNGAPVCEPADYARTLNKLREIAMERKVPVPLHFTLDQENHGPDNYTLGKLRLFTNQAGLAASGDPDLVYRAMKVQARQLHSVGLNWLHSPVLDVNTDHENPEIGTRSYSDRTETVSEFGSATLRALIEEKIIATAKHFPGRGQSKTNAHHSMPVIDLSKDELMNVHMAPYRRLIKEGLPSIMTAHTLYPAFDADEPATLSHRFMTEILREEMGFEGALESDNMLMGGIVYKYGVAEACVRALIAGVDILLIRVEHPLAEEAFHAIKDAVKEGRLSESRLDEANRRILRVKYDYGLFKKGGMVDPEQAAAPQTAPENIAVEHELAEKATLLRNRNGLLPLSKDAKVLLINDVHTTHRWVNNYECHAATFWNKMLEQAPNVYCVEYMQLDDENRSRIERRIPEADVLVATNWEPCRGCGMRTEYIRSLERFGKPIVVVTNSPYENVSPADFPTVVFNFSANPASLEAAAKIIFGDLKPQGVNPINRPDLLQ